MSGDERNYLDELTIKLSSSAQQVSDAVKRLQMAELTYREHLVRIRKLEEHMRELLDMLHGRQDAAGETTPDCSDTVQSPPQTEDNARHRRLSYADYLEFSNYSELKRFEGLGEISEKDISEFDADEALRQILKTPEA